MKIEHIAIWVSGLEQMKAFYENYFEGQAGPKYINAKKGFESYFLSFQQGSRLELMKKADIPDNQNDPYLQYQGIIHMAISVGSKQKVDSLTERLRKDGYEVIGEARTTGDGYYESVVFDPEKNRIEITV